ncbi:hypothetical protein [Streptomyces sp. NPDC056255]|uniref:ATP-dependent DNA ligase n=1 Tax=Streptomyces sp. NPDC056255 TaxID=3345764 RepID=UPI0035DD0BAD
MELCPGTVLDGEAVIWRDVRLDFASAQSWAGPSVTRARALAARYPASYVCWNVLQSPDPAIGDCRRRPCTERRAFLLGLLADVGPPVQAGPATGDRDVAVLWYDALREQGIEGIVCKRGGAGCPSGQRRWVKVRHAGTVDALVLGFTRSWSCWPWPSAEQRGRTASWSTMSSCPCCSAGSTVRTPTGCLTVLC